MSEPIKICAGTDISWRRDVDDSDAATYSYRLLSDSSVITIEAVLDAGIISVDVAAETSRAWRTGQYKWFLTRTFSGAINRVATGYLNIEADATQDTHLQTKSHAEKMLDLIEARMEGRILSDYQRYTTVDGRSLDRIPIAELQTLRIKYRLEVQKELIKKGLRVRPRRVIYW